MIQLLTWGIVAIGMVVVFSLPGTIENWGDNRLKTILLALLILFGFGSDLILRCCAASKRWGYRKDERDKNISTRAVSVGMIALVIYIFLFSITLYTCYETEGILPVGWMWFLAYSAIVVANVAVCLASLILYVRHGC